MTAKHRTGTSTSSRSVAIAEAIKLRILDGRYPAGDRLPTEAELCSEFGVSRLTLREALQMLSALGLVDPVRGRGTFVREPDPEAVLRDIAYFAFDTGAAVRDLFEVRTILEAQAVRVAVTASGPDKAELVRIARRGLAIAWAESGDGAADPEEQTSLDTAFHVHLAAVGGNLVLELLVKRLLVLLTPIRQRLHGVPDLSIELWHRHLGIAEAIAAGDHELAARLVADHNVRVLQALEVE